MVKFIVVVVLIVFFLFLLKYSIPEDAKKVLNRIQDICDKEGKDYKSILEKAGITPRELTSNLKADSMVRLLDELNISDEHFLDPNRIPVHRDAYVVEFKCSNCGNVFNEEFKKGTVVEEEIIDEVTCKTRAGEKYISCRNCGFPDIRKNFN